MAKSATNPEVDWFFNKETKWQQTYEALRVLVLACGLKEELKWGCPCYTLENNNVVLIHGFKNYCALLFMQGALLKDPKNLLTQQTENVQAARQMRFTDEQEVLKNKSEIKAFIKEAIANEKAGLKFMLKKTSAFKMVEEFKNALDEMPELKAAFESLTPGRQRGYLLYFSSAKQAQTRVARIEKYIPQILEGKGLDD